MFDSVDLIAPSAQAEGGVSDGVQKVMDRLYEESKTQGVDVLRRVLEDDGPVRFADEPADE